MLVKEYYKTRADGVNLFRTYSNKGVQIHKIGTDEIYDEAVDIEGKSYVYEETENLIENTDEA